MRDFRNTSPVRKLICAEAARIMAEEGVRDFQHAKRKASNRLAVGQSRDWPTNIEVKHALGERLRLFGGADRVHALKRIRRVALDAMQLLSHYNPRVVGSLLDGDVTSHTPVELHVFADTTEEVALFVEDSGIPMESFDKRFRFGGGRYKTIPGMRFAADDVQLTVCVFGPSGIREPPLDPVDGRPMRRMARTELQQTTFE